ncbi:MAG: DUF2147 domain-containing protein [Pseudorhodoplanes sp.]
MKAPFLGLILVACLGLILPAAAAEPNAAGLWAQVEESGKIGGWFFITERNGFYEGTIVKMFFEPGEDTHPICTKCPGEDKNMPSLGLTIIKGMKRKGVNYEDGTILDPRDGSIYRARMQVSPDGQKLTVRGFLGISLLGRSQIWNRLPESAAVEIEPALRTRLQIPAPRTQAAPGSPAFPTSRPAPRN